MNQRIRKWTSQISSFSPNERESHYQDYQTIFQTTNTMHTGSNEIGLEEKIKFKGTAEFSFEIEEPTFPEIELTAEKKKKLIKSETRDGRKSKHKSSNLF